MTKLIIVLLYIVLVLILADLVAGTVHWFEDAYVREDTPLIGSLVGKANVIHHHLPRYMTRNNWWQSSWDLLAFAALVVFCAWQLGLLTWQVWLFAAISANANEVHKWSHRTRRENGRIITFLQNLRVLQTSQHHAIHHTNPKNVRYCPITNLVNPLLDYLRFWDGLEWLLARTLSLHRRPDTSLPGSGPAPGWLNRLRDQSKHLVAADV
jgi:ubiquitin-conjugating enzyme E2 variant